MLIDVSLVRLSQHFLITFICALSLYGCQSQPDKASQDLEKLFADEWEFRLQENPLFATQFGDHRFDDRLPDVSEAAQLRRLEQEREFFGRLAAIDRSALSQIDKLNYDLFKRLKENRIAEFEFKTYLMPITGRSGFHVSFPELPDRVPLKTEQDYLNYISRLQGFNTYVQQHIELMRKGRDEGIILPQIVLEGIEGSLKPHIVRDVRESLLFEPFNSFPKAFAVDQIARLLRLGESAILSSVVPGYRQFLDFIERDYVPQAREDIAASSLPNGAEFYKHRVRYFTTLDLTPEDVHSIGLKEVTRIRAEMDTILKKVGFKGDLADFIHFLRTDPQFYVSTAENLMKEVAFVLKKMDGQLPKLFKTLPRMSYGIRPIPDYIAPKTTTAYYSRPAGDGSRAGFYYVNTYDLKTRPLYEIEALSLHEAVPGHHLQIAIQQELEGIPNFRRYSGFTAFTEGWALYSERLGLEAGFYEDSYSDFGRLTYEMWRACRLVVDTGMHALGWSRQQAIDFMAENTALTLHNITTEVDRYIAWPGQALAYKMGELKIRELREQAESSLGSDFDIRLFHDVVLGSGAIPLDILEKNIEEWIEENALPTPL